MASRGPKCENLSAWIFWDTGEFENGARSYIFITLKRLREYGKYQLSKDLGNTVVDLFELIGGRS